MADETATPDVKPGFKTTEFWLMLIVTIAGLLPSAGIFKTDSVVLKVAGLVVSVISTLGYGFFRTSVKNAAQILMLCLLPLWAVGCHKGEIQVGNVAPLTTDVCDRHDKLIKGELDPKSISEADKATYLRSSALLRKVLDEARK